MSAAAPVGTGQGDPTAGLRERWQERIERHAGRPTDVQVPLEGAEVLLQDRSEDADELLVEEPHALPGRLGGRGRPLRPKPFRARLERLHRDRETTALLHQQGQLVEATFGIRPRLLGAQQGLEVVQQRAGPVELERAEGRLGVRERLLERGDLARATAQSADELLHRREPDEHRLRGGPVP